MIWNPRYVAYCTAHGNAPENQLAADVKEYPGGHMCGFILWHGAKVRRWAKEVHDVTSEFETNMAMTRHSDEYDAWLAEEAEREATNGPRKDC